MNFTKDSSRADGYISSVELTTRSSWLPYLILIVLEPRLCLVTSRFMPFFHAVSSDDLKLGNSTGARERCRCPRRKGAMVQIIVRRGHLPISHLSFFWCSRFVASHLWPSKLWSDKSPIGCWYSASHDHGHSRRALPKGFIKDDCLYIVKPDDSQRSDVGILHSITFKTVKTVCNGDGQFSRPWHYYFFTLVSDRFQPESLNPLRWCELLRFAWVEAVWHQTRIRQSNEPDQLATELNRMSERSEIIGQRTQSSFLANVSYELRTLVSNARSPLMRAGAWRCGWAGVKDVFKPSKRRRSGFRLIHDLLDLDACSGCHAIRNPSHFRKCHQPCD